MTSGGSDSDAPTLYTWYCFCVLSWELKAHGLGSSLCDELHVVSFPGKSLPVWKGKGGSPFFLCFLAVPGQACRDRPVVLETS